MTDRKFTTPQAVSGNPTTGSTASLRLTKLPEPSAAPTHTPTEFDQFAQLAHALVRVPKSDVDAKRREA
jgi:hypothetical protein